MQICMYNGGDVLVHHGIKGMRWGIRRYQNKDGSLTPAGRKRAAKLEEKYERTTGRKIGSKDTKRDEPIDTKKIKVSKLTDDEVRKVTDRLRLERDLFDVQSSRNRVKSSDISELAKKTKELQEQAAYLEAKRRVDQLSPQKISAGKRFADKFLNDVLIPGAKEVGKTYVQNLLKEKLNMNDKSMDALKKAAAKNALLASNEKSKFEYVNNKNKLAKAMSGEIVEGDEKKKKKKKDDDD